MSKIQSQNFNSATAKSSNSLQTRFENMSYSEVGEKDATSSIMVSKRFKIRDELSHCYDKN